MKSKPKIKSSNWRIIIPNLTQYVNSSPEGLRQLKALVLQRLNHRPQAAKSNIKSQFQRGLRHYCIALERHANGVPHLDILLIYDKSIQRQLTDYDFLYKHGNITTYRRLNDAIITYGFKQDPQPLANFTLSSKIPEASVSTNPDPMDLAGILDLHVFKQDPYLYLQTQMRKDPLRFNVQQYVQQHNLAQYISGWSSIKNKLKDMQGAAANLLLKSKPGFKLITQDLIRNRLSPEEYALYHGPWDGYKRIVSYLNQMLVQKGFRQMKTLNLLISGPPSIGKTSLFSNPNHKPDKSCIQDFCSVYPMGMSQWFPKYSSHVYHMILWNEAKLTSYSYDIILKLLQGSYMDLPNKGSVSRKVDNPLVVMTSNMTLQDMIAQKFGYNRTYIQMARANLAVRVQNVIVPEGYDLFLLQKLLVPVGK